MKIIRNSFSTSIFKRLAVSLLAIGMAAHLTGCAMGGPSDEGGEGGDETFAEESAGDFAEGEESADGSEDGDVAAEGGEGDDLAEEVASESDGGEEGGAEAPAEGEVADAASEGGDDLALEGEAAGEATDAGTEGGTEDVALGDDDELSLDDEEGLPSDIASNSGGENPPIVDEPMAAPTDAPVFEDPSTETASAPVEPVAPPSWTPLKKVKTEAFMAGSTNLNRVYVARPGDTRPEISQKIYGDKTRSNDLLSWNGFLSRGVKTGDKIYYASPTNPTDTAMLTYYEDIGIPAQNYVSRDGDNIREVATTLLGDKDSWKEVWATNPDIESKGQIPAGLNIRYWPNGAAPTQTLAQVTEPPPFDPNTPPVGVDPLTQQQPMVGTNTDPLAQPPADPLAPNDPVAMQPPADGLQQQPLNDPLAQPTGTPASVPQVGTVVDPAPPAEPPMTAQTEPRQAQPPIDQGMAGTGTEEADNMMMMGLGGIVLLAAGAVFFLMRRSRSRKVDLTQTTQVG